VSSTEGTTWLIYVDDSGDAQHDLLTALCFPVWDWASCLGAWKKYRVHLSKRIGFPLGCEFHSANFLSRRTLSVVDPRTGGQATIPYEISRSNGEKVSRPKLFEAGLKTIAACKHVRVLTCYSHAPNGAAKLYRPLLEWIEEFLSWTNSYGIVWFDGLGESLIVERHSTHRELILKTRRVLEDGIPVDSNSSHFIQMADVVAHSALRAVRGDGPPHLRDSYRHLVANCVPGGKDNEGFPALSHELGFRVVPEKQ
jgi:hypothetical protein